MLIQAHVHACVCICVHVSFSHVLVPVASWCNEVEATVHPGVRDDLFASHTVLLIEVEVKLIIDVVQYRCPANINIIPQYNEHLQQYLYNNILKANGLSGSPSENTTYGEANDVQIFETLPPLKLLRISLDNRISQDDSKHPGSSSPYCGICLFEHFILHTPCHKSSMQYVTFKWTKSTVQDLA